MSLEIISVVSSIAAVIVSAIPLIKNYLSMRREYKKSSKLELRFQGDGEDGETRKITIDSNNLSTGEIERLLRTLNNGEKKKFAAAPPEELK